MYCKEIIIFEVTFCPVVHPEDSTSCGSIVITDSSKPKRSPVKIFQVPWRIESVVRNGAPMEVVRTAQKCNHPLSIGKPVFVVLCLFYCSEIMLSHLFLSKDI